MNRATKAKALFIVFLSSFVPMQSYAEGNGPIILGDAQMFQSALTKELLDAQNKGLELAGVPVNKSSFLSSAAAEVSDWAADLKKNAFEDDIVSTKRDLRNFYCRYILEDKENLEKEAMVRQLPFADGSELIRKKSAENATKRAAETALIMRGLNETYKSIREAKSGFEKFWYKEEFYRFTLKNFKGYPVGEMPPGYDLQEKTPEQLKAEAVKAAELEREINDKREEEARGPLTPELKAAFSRFDERQIPFAWHRGQEESQAPLTNMAHLGDETKKQLDQTSTQLIEANSKFEKVLEVARLKAQKEKELKEKDPFVEGLSGPICRELLKGKSTMNKSKVRLAEILAEKIATLKPLDYADMMAIIQANYRHAHVSIYPHNPSLIWEAVQELTPRILGYIAPELAAAQQDKENGEYAPFFWFLSAANWVWVGSTLTVGASKLGQVGYHGYKGSGFSIMRGIRETFPSVYLWLAKRQKTRPWKIPPPEAVKFWQRPLLMPPSSPATHTNTLNVVSETLASKQTSRQAMKALISNQVRLFMKNENQIYRIMMLEGSLIAGFSNVLYHWRSKHRTDPNEYVGEMDSQIVFQDLWNPLAEYYDYVEGLQNKYIVNSALREENIILLLKLEEELNGISYGVTRTQELATPLFKHILDTGAIKDYPQSTVSIESAFNIQANAAKGMTDNLRQTIQGEIRRRDQEIADKEAERKRTAVSMNVLSGPTKRLSTESVDTWVPGSGAYVEFNRAPKGPFDYFGTRMRLAPRELTDRFKMNVKLWGEWTKWEMAIDPTEDLEGRHVPPLGEMPDFSALIDVEGDIDGTSPIRKQLPTDLPPVDFFGLGLLPPVPGTPPVNKPTEVKKVSEVVTEDRSPTDGKLPENKPVETTVNPMENKPGENKAAETMKPAEPANEAVPIRLGRPKTAAELQAEIDAYENALKAEKK